MENKSRLDEIIRKNTVDSEGNDMREYLDKNKLKQEIRELFVSMVDDEIKLIKSTMLKDLKHKSNKISLCTIGRLGIFKQEIQEELK